ncbi:AAEL003653-PA [Aedes aegypti]|uniref:AAEL003653-PA n=1 Tax=Aedes aegypti TaxID=7159 RepID=Q17EW7_AEDAE|nr:AAEL003653-PA [Aedes aegypti]
MISEGAEGQTRQELYDVLKFPADREQVRSAFDESLKRLSAQNPANEPQFKSWFYIYKDNTIKPEYRDVLQNSYYVDVRDIERNDYNFDEPKTSLGSIEPSIDLTPDEEAIVVGQVVPSNNNSKDIIDFEDLKIKSVPLDNVRSDVGIATKFDEVEEGDNPKFDKNIEDKQYVEPTQIKEEIAKQKDEHTNEVLDEPVLKAAEDRVDQVVEDAPQKFSLSLKKLDGEEHETMHAVESQASRQRFNVRRSFLSGDVASALSGNSLVGRKANAKEGEEDQNESKMLLFNGLYYRGSWASPFQVVCEIRINSDVGTFSVNGQQKPVTMMRSSGTFSIGSSQELDAKYIQLPYNNSRYSLMLMMPNQADGLKDLIKNFNCRSLSSAQKELSEMPVQITMPKFQIDTTSRAEKALAKLGLINVFTSKANLSGITDEQKIHVDELVQHVSIRVDEGSSSETALSATNKVEAKTTGVEMEEFVIDRPFLFFVRDIVDDLVIVAGKINDVPALEE